MSDLNIDKLTKEFEKLQMRKKGCIRYRINKRKEEYTFNIYTESNKFICNPGGTLTNFQLVDKINKTMVDLDKMEDI